MKRLFLLLFVIVCAGAMSAQTTFILKYTETTGSSKYINIGDVRVIYPRSTGSSMIQGSTLTSVLTTENVAYFISSSCNNLMEFEEQVASSGSSITHRTIAINPERINSLQRTSSGKAIIRYTEPVISLTSYLPFDSVFADLTACNSALFSGDLVGSGAITITGGAGAVLGSGTTISINPDSLELDSLAGCLSPVKICQDGAANGEALIWNGTEWAPGSTASCSDSLSFFANDSIAAIGGIAPYDLYGLTSGNYYGMASGLVKVSVEGWTPSVIPVTFCGISSNTLLVYDNDTKAKLSGLAVNDYYILSTHNSYGMSPSIKAITEP